MISIGSAQGFTTDELNQLQEAVDLSNNILSLDDFKSAVLSAEFTDCPDANQVVYDRMTKGNFKVAFSIRSYPWWNIGKRSEVAHENPDGSVVCNRRFFDGEHVEDHADTVVHETAHKAGYVHPYSPSVERDRSVPYTLGAIVRQLALQFNAKKAQVLS